MPCSPDLPAWINAASVVVLAAITAWYAHSTRDLVRAVRDEREERTRELRRPVATLLDEIERKITEAKAMLAATEFKLDMDDISPAVRQSYERTNDVADLYRTRSERVYRELWKLRPAMQRLPEHVAAAVGDLRTGRDRYDSRERLNEALASVIKVLDTTRRALDLVV